jgi:hypothetical protein
MFVTRRSRVPIKSLLEATFSVPALFEKKYLNKPEGKRALSGQLLVICYWLLRGRWFYCQPLTDNH